MSDGLAPIGSGHGGSEPPLTEEILRATYDRLLRACSFEGVAAPDAEDVAQDFFLWLTSHPDRASLASASCIGSVVANYVMRHRRRAHLRREREGVKLECVPAAGATAPACNETTMSVQRLGRLLPAIEAGVLRELKAGATWAEACAKVGIAQGSRDWLRKRMAGHVRDAFSPTKPAGRAASGPRRRPEAKA